MGAFGIVPLLDGQTLDAVFALTGPAGLNAQDPAQGDNAPPQYSAMVLTSSSQWAFQSMDGSILIPNVPCSDNSPGAQDVLVIWARVRQSDGSYLWPWPRADRPFFGLRSETDWGCQQLGFLARLLAFLVWLFTFKWLRH
jgi:hypothetical protein